jgi:hypothetical protein
MQPPANEQRAAGWASGAPRPAGEAGARPRTIGRPRLPQVARLWATAALALLLVLGTAGTLSAAGNSLPGQVLYPVKRAVEAAQLALTPANNKAEAQLELLQERTRELTALRNDPTTPPGVLAEAAAALTNQNEAALNSVPSVPAEKRVEFLEAMVSVMAAAEATLAAAADSAPPEAALALVAALDQAHDDRAMAEAALAEAQQNPNPPPGQTNVPPGQTNIPPGQTNVPPGQTHIPDQTNGPPGQTNVPPGQTNIPPGQTNVPPGQASKTTTPDSPGPSATPEPSNTPRPTNDPGPAEPNCQAGNPNSPNYCTATPGNPPTEVVATEGSGGPDTPNCQASNPNSPNFCTPTPGAAASETPAPTNTSAPPTSTQAPAAIAGNVKAPGNQGVFGVVINVTGGGSATTDGEGNYSVGSLTAGTYEVVPQKDGCNFSPESRTVSVAAGETASANFVAHCGD